MRELRISATIDNFENMINFILETIEELELDKRVTSKLRLVSEELLINVINYAYPEKEGEVLIRTKLNNDRELFLQIVDSGVPFNPLEKEDPDITIPMEDRKIGGLGIFMVKTIMDSVAYEYISGENILTLTKKL